MEISAPSTLAQEVHWIFQSDSTNAGGWLLKPESNQWRMLTEFNSINIIVKKLKMGFCHVLREENAAADSLARQGVQRSSDFIAWIQSLIIDQCFLFSLGPPRSFTKKNVYIKIIIIGQCHRYLLITLNPKPCKIRNFIKTMQNTYSQIIAQILKLVRKQET